MKNKKVKDVLDWLLYSNIFIAICAVCMVVVSRRFYPGHEVIPVAYEWCIFMGTLSLYAFHRYLGIKRVQENLRSGRFHIIIKYRSHLLFYGFGSLLIAAFILFYNFSVSFILSLLPAAIISALYIIPIFPDNRRLRDFAYIKIVLVGLIWAWVTAYVPLYESDIASSDLWLYTFERFLFIVAITLPFDIRDIEVDEIESTLTIPRTIGVRMSKWIASASLIMAFSIVLYLYYFSFASNTYIMATGITYILVLAMISKSDIERHDFYYSGLLDGSMVLYFLMISILEYL